MNVNFQIMKRLLCCLLAVLVLFCAFVRPIEASAVAVATGAAVCGITTELAVSAAITALGIAYLSQVDYEKLVASISASVPGKFLIETAEKGKQVCGLVYDKTCYLSKDFISWVSEKLWTGTTTTTATPAVSHTYGFTGGTEYVYQNCVSWLNSAYPGELKKCTAYSNCYVTAVLDDDGNRYDICAFSDGDVEFKIDSSGYFCWGTTTDAKLIYTSGVKSNYLTAWRKGLVEDMTFSKVFPCASTTADTIQGTGSLVFGDGLRSNGSIASSLDDEIYAGWTGKAITVSDSRTIYLPISVADTIAGTGSLTQDVAQAGTTYYPGAVEETDEELPLVDVPAVGADLLGIVTLLKSILQVLLNIYRVVSSNISSWWDNATTTIALNIASLAASIETWWTTATETIIGGITDAVTSITEAISSAIADVVTWLKSVAATLTDILEWAKGLPAAISQAISTAIADIIEWLKSLGATIADILEFLSNFWSMSLQALRSLGDYILNGIKSIFVPSEDFITAKVESLRARFDWINPFVIFAKNISGELFSTEPPVIYIHLDDAEGSYNYGGTIPFLDMRWYARYKEQGDLILSGFLWALFAWRMYLKLPGIISGASGTIGHISSYSRKDDD